MRSRSLVTVLIIFGAFLAVLLPQVAHADFSFYGPTSPHSGACWQKVNAYGGVYQVQNVMVNDSGAAHTVQITVDRPGTGIAEQYTYNIAVGEWKTLATVNVAIVPNDVWSYKVDGTVVASIPANGIPYYMQNCLVKTSPSGRLRTALSYGLSQLDAYYTGCNGGTYRMGGTAGTDQYFVGSACGQSNYKLPAGRTGFDCSGLVYQMMRTAGVPFSYTSSADMASLPAVSGPAQVGDLLVNPGHHVAVFLGDGDGSGVPSVLEATPKQILTTSTVWGVAYRQAIGVVISDATPYYDPVAGRGINGYTVRRVPGL